MLFVSCYRRISFGKTHLGKFLNFGQEFLDNLGMLLLEVPVKLCGYIKTSSAYSDIVTYWGCCRSQCGRGDRKQARDYALRSLMNHVNALVGLTLSAQQGRSR